MKSISLLNGGNQSFEAVTSAAAQQTSAEIVDKNDTPTVMNEDGTTAKVPQTPADGSVMTDVGTESEQDTPENTMVAEQEDVMSLTPSQRKVLQSLANRRTELKEREAQYQLREKLLSATEKRLKERMTELENLKDSIGTAVEKKDEAETKRMAGLVKMYETMKAKEAARIFERLDLPILVLVVKQMNPRKMAGILGKMSPDSAQRLTVALATGQMDMPRDNGPSILPKINGN